MGRKGVFFVAIAAAAVACGYADAGPSSLDRDAPARATTDVTDSTPLPPSQHGGATDAGGGGGDAGSTVEGGAFDASTRSFFCKQPGIALCLPFEAEAVDRSGNALDLSVTNVSYVDGHAGKAALLDATSSIRLAPSSLFDGPEATVEAWVNRVSGEGVVFDSDNRYSLTVLAGGKVQCVSSGGSTAAGNAPTGQWVHVACVIGGGKISVFVDGVRRDQDNGGIKASAGSTEAVGGNAPSGEPFVGAIDSVRVFNVARTDQEIAEAAQ